MGSARCGVLFRKGKICSWSARGGKPTVGRMESGLVSGVPDREERKKRQEAA